MTATTADIQAVFAAIALSLGGGLLVLCAAAAILRGKGGRR